MAKNANLNIRIDPKIKQDSEQLFASFGITISDAVNIFLHKSLMVGGLPFDVMHPKPNAETIAAMEEAKRIAHDPNAKRYSNFAELLSDVKLEMQNEV